MATTAALRSAIAPGTPFTPASLLLLRSLLASRPPSAWLMQRPPGWQEAEVTGEAATLLGLCNVRRTRGGKERVEGGVVLTVRGQGLRTHGGEVRSVVLVLSRRHVSRRC